MANDIVQKDYSRYVTTKRQADDKKLERYVFTDSEIARLFDLVPEQPGADLLLIMIYTGLRVGELFDLKTEGKQFKYANFRRRYFLPIIEQEHWQHSTHDCRHTFFTRMDNAGANHVATKLIGGHSSYKTTEKIYTHKEIDDLRDAIELI